MGEFKDTYQTLSKPSPEILFKEKKSKFFGYAFPILSDDEIKPLIASIRKKHPNAGHVCYAWQLGVQNIRYRANDDGEPNNSAGQPIYGQIQSFKVTNILVAVARIFGGTKLGVGGLIAAYRTAGQMALSSADVITKTITAHFKLNFGYDDLDRVMRIIKQKKYKVVSQELEIKCALVISVPQNQSDELVSVFQELHKVSITEIK